MNGTPSAFTAIALVVALAVASCGSDAAPRHLDASAEVVQGLAQCLRGAGAELAQNSGDLPALIREDLAAGQVDNPAGAGNGVAKVVQYELSGVADQTGKPRPSKYLVFVAQPADQADLDPVSATDDDSAATLVAYLLSPTVHQVTAAQRCVDAFGSSATAAG